MNRINLVGKKFGRLKVVSFFHGGKRAYWSCKCSCGKTKVIRSDGLRSGHTKSCGCLAIEASKNNAKKCGKENRTHGMTKKSEWRSWQAMKTRCYNQKHKYWKQYGGRGIKICRAWEGSFENFYKDMGPRPPGTSIDRINNDGNYTPSNCRWATPKQQAQNRRKTKEKRKCLRNNYSQSMR